MITITYTLYRRDSQNPQGDYYRVTGADLELEAKLSEADKSHLVDEAGNPTEQSQIVDEHVRGYFEDQPPVGGHQLEFPLYKDSRYNGKNWDPVLTGASVIYCVHPQGGNTGDELCLAVAT